MTKPTEKYAVSNAEILIDIKNRLDNNGNVVTICTLKNILKGRAKRGDIDALDMYIKYSTLKIITNGNAKKYELSIESIYDTLHKIYNDFHVLDKKDQDACTLFEDFEDQYYYGGLNNVR